MIAVSQRLAISDGFWSWCHYQDEIKIVPTESALIICDMWDQHWSRGATIRANILAPKIQELASVLRSHGVLVAHCPSGTMDFYRNNPAYIRVHQCTPIWLPIIPGYPELPIDDSDGGSDTGEQKAEHVWTRQHSAIDIDPDCDVICDNGSYLFSYFKQRNISTVFVCGVHTNMCILNRSFGLKALVRCGFSPYLITDLTDSMYNPARRPYVSHDEGTRLVISYVEQFICETTESQEVLKSITSPFG